MHIKTLFAAFAGTAVAAAGSDYGDYLATAYPMPVAISSTAQVTGFHIWRPIADARRTGALLTTSTVCRPQPPWVALLETEPRWSKGKELST